ncbi:class I SAM-dependent methyltransferase [Spongiactinospora sp. TRM90649]|uniref:class I SAM-dependent methyltransferase n=1 Tax=Spongiactinospora sp. TRM90649 TaxID=3031114 RepID=UPI0023F6372B|nr:class I SAM-dependent methyltransferase [Spongiactinospora sp. TRM90649]MDF5758024.1 class I SAM-dependent methyltransferase [Spongiactinospora sp. TRM90649]
MTAKDGKRWNHNIHYHPRILAAVPEGARDALDVGCGEGTLARELRRRVARVTGIDRDAVSIGHARAHPGDIEYVLDDFLTHPFEPASFDVVASVATLHHMDAVAGLERMRGLLRPGGMLAVVGLARGSMPKDLPREVVTMAVSTYLRATRGHWQHPSPTVWPPPLTYSQVREVAAEVLPGSEFRRHLLWRYSVLWRKPRG